MTEDNKNRLVKGGKVALFGITAFMALITTAGVLNGITCGLDSFYGYVACLNLCTEGYLFYNWYKKLF